MKKAKTIFLILIGLPLALVLYSCAFIAIFGRIPLIRLTMRTGLPDWIKYALWGWQ